MSGEPPRLAERLLCATLRDPALQEEIAGDLRDEYTAKPDGLRRQAWYWLEAARLSIRYAAKPRQKPPIPIDQENSVSNFRSDIAFAFRMIRKQPSFSLIVALTLAFGLGVNATVFGMMDAMLLRPFRFPEYDRLLMVWEKTRGDSQRESVAPADFLEWRRQARTLERISAWEGWDATLTGTQEPVRVQGFRVAHGFFELLGVLPAEGTTFHRDEEAPGNYRRVIISDGLWKRSLGARPGLIGTTILIAGEAHTIAGIAPPDFDFPGGAQIWAPLSFTTQRAADRTKRSLSVIAKLAAGSSVADAQAEMSLIGRRLEQQYPETNRDRVVSVESLSDAFREGMIGPLFGTLMACSGLVLLVACMNIAGLLLARAVDRQRELAVRTALGASRLRIVRQLVTETTVLGLLASALGLLLAGIGLDVLRNSLPAEVAQHVEGWKNLRLDSRLMFVVPALSIFVGLFVGVMPALAASRKELIEALKEGARGSSGGLKRQRSRQLLVIAEIATALALLVCAGLAVSGGVRMVNQSGGFDSSSLLTFSVPLPDNVYGTPDAKREFAGELLRRLQSLPAAQAASIANILPAGGWNPSATLAIEDHPVADPARRPRAGYRSVSAGYFEAMKVPIVRGRAFADSDRENTEPVAIISASLAGRYWPGRDPVGRRLRLDGSKTEWLNIVGVAGDVSMYNWWDGVDFTAVYVPLRQSPPTGALQAVIRTRGEPGLLSVSVREVLKSIHSGLPADNIRTMRQAIEQNTTSLNIIASLMAICGAIAATLAMIGIYSVMAYAMSQRQHEFGVRIALGATHASILRLTLLQAGTLTSIGLGIGVAAAIVFGRLMASGFEGVISLDAKIFAAVVPALALVAIGASYLPARRAVRVDPVSILRAE